jgi:hypothetical protein
LHKNLRIKADNDLISASPQNAMIGKKSDEGHGREPADGASWYGA